MYTRFFVFLNQYPKLIILVAIAVSAFFWVQVQQKLLDPRSGELIVDSTIKPLIERDSGAYQEFLEVREAFGNEDVVVVALHQPDKPIGLELIDAMASLSRDIRKKIPGVNGVTSLLDI
ncbi:uncharacterized protein METZ01_LOCUS305743, partial [marine metagenome]